MTPRSTLPSHPFSPRGELRWYYLEDDLGSVVGEVNQSGGLGNRYEYDPSGSSIGLRGVEHPHDKWHVQGAPRA